MIGYNQDDIPSHVNKTHTEKETRKKKAGKMIACQWETPDEGVCGSYMRTDQLRRHVLDLHTTLMVSECNWCGEGHRKDVLKRHKKICRKRR